MTTTRMTVRGAPTPELLLRLVNLLHQRDIRLRAVEARFADGGLVVTADIIGSWGDAFDALLERVRAMVLVADVRVE